jgi:copper resistance protein D
LRALYLPSVTLHVLAAMFWLGGMFFLGFVGAPVLRHVQPPEPRQQLFNTLGVRFRALGWWAVAVLLATGVLNLRYRGWLAWDGALGFMGVALVIAAVRLARGG